MPPPMRESEAQTVLAVKAFEEADPQGSWIPFPARERASARARADAGPAADALSTDVAETSVALRAAALRETLDARLPWLRALLRATRFGAGLWPWALVGGLVVGVLLNELGPTRQIDVLKLPLLALLAWNVAVYVAILVRWISRRLTPDRAPRGDREPTDPWLGRLLARAAEARSRRKAGSAPDAVVQARAVASYLSAWRAVSAPLTGARTLLIFHLGAAALALGVVVGMYLRGLTTEYRATWQSTFLGTEATRGVLSVFLWPATFIRGGGVPPVEGIRSPLDGPAAPWIHLYAIQTLLVVVLPRAALAALAARRCARIRHRLPLDLSGAYFRAFLAPTEGASVRVEILSYARREDPRAAAALRSLLLDLYGRGADLVTLPSADYGAEAAQIPFGRGDVCAHRVVVFDAAATPEEEVHVRFVSEVRDDTAPGHDLRVLVDASGLRERGFPEDRVRERRRAWDRAVPEGSSPFGQVDLLHPERDAGDPLARLRGEVRG
jgi:hypothetical protein